MVYALVAIIIGCAIVIGGIVAAAADAAVVIVINFLGFQRFHILVVRFPM